MTAITPEETDDLRARVQRLAARGVPAPLVHVLVGAPRKYERFVKVYKKELAQGSAEADAAVSEALFDLALSGKSPPATLAWAKQRLGWNTSEDAHTTTDQQARRETQAADAMATLCALLDQLAAGKSGSYHHAPELAEDSPPRTAATSGRGGGGSRGG